MRWNPIDWIDYMLCTIVNGGGERIGWYAPEALSGIRLLRSHGVRTWGVDSKQNPDRRYVTVRRRQARWAVGLLMGGRF